MMIGQPAQFAIEFGISEAFERRSILAIGFFVIHVGEYRYGRLAPDSTAIACSFDEVERRIAQRGTHTAPFVAGSSAELIAESVRNAIYAETGPETFFGLSAKDFCDLIYSNHLLWAPDGDQAFDDGSYVLQFDSGDQVRLIGFRTTESSSFDTRDVWMAQETFYNILLQWQSAFQNERMSMLRDTNAKNI